VVAVCVVVPPLGAARVKVTLAPEAGVPPFVTSVVIGTMLGREKLVPDTETTTANAGGVITVAFAVPMLLAELFDAVKFTP
jgi:hypothetical protein